MSRKKFVLVAGLTAVVIGLALASLLLVFSDAPSPARVPHRAIKPVTALVERPSGPVGCWEISPSVDAESTTLEARWHLPCPTPSPHPAKLGEGELPTHPFVLPAWSSEVPLMSGARRLVQLSPDLTAFEDFEAGMLYLPVTADGRGYFLAAWSAETEDGTAIRGMKLGLYGNTPTSVETSVGRVFMDAPVREPVDLSAGAAADVEGAREEQNEPDKG